jgi:hypothetical protein
VGIFIDAPKGLAGVLAFKRAEAGARHIDKHDVADVEEAVGVVG